MTEQLTIEEKFSPHWTRVTLGLALFTMVAFIIYSYTGNVLWKGYARLIAFCGMAATIFSALKVRQGQYIVEMALKNGTLSIGYRRINGCIVYDRYELSNIDSLMVKRRRSGTPGVDLLLRDLLIVANLKDSDSPVHFLVVEGRPLSLSRQSVDEVIRFITGHAPKIHIDDKL